MIRLGNIQFSQVREYLGYELTAEDKIIWDKYHCNAADLSEKVACFHVFDMPRCIVFKGEDAGNAILQMFKPEKMKEAVGKIHVYKQ